MNSNDFFSSVFLTDSKLKPPMDYVTYGCLRGYLRQKLEGCGKTIPELAQACGYKLEKFKRHLVLWLKAERPIPKSFLDAIGLEPEMVYKVLEIDLDLYEQAVKKVCLPSTFSAKLMPAIWQSVRLPEGMDEAEAERHVADFAKREKRECLINFEGLRETWIEPDGSIYRRFRRPSLEFKKRMLYFTLSSRQPGTSRLVRKGFP